jgi:hypothetical protein
MILIYVVLLQSCRGDESKGAKASSLAHHEMKFNNFNVPTIIFYLYKRGEIANTG